MTAFKVRLKDGVEVGPLDIRMLHSWYEQGMIGPDSPVRPSGHKKWVRLDSVVDIKDWGRPGGSGGGAIGVKDIEDEEGDVYEGDEAALPASPQTWRYVLGALLLFAAAAGAGYVFLFPERWRADLAVVPWREIGLGFVLLGLLVVSGSEPLRKAARVLLFLATFSLIPLAAFAIVPVVQPRLIALLFAGWVMGSGLFFLLTGRFLRVVSTLLSLMWTIVGAAGVVYLGYVPPQGAFPPIPGLDPPAAGPAAGPPVTAAPRAALPAPTATAPAAGMSAPAVSSPPPAAPSTPAVAVRSSRTVTDLRAEVPLLSPTAAQTLLARNEPRPGEGFKIAYGTASRGLDALSPNEARELGLLMTATYAALSGDERRALTNYTDKVRGGVETAADVDTVMGRLMREAVLKLPEEQRGRLQALFEKAIEAGK